jgi:hypothetical protein
MIVNDWTLTRPYPLDNEKAYVNSLEEMWGATAFFRTPDLLDVNLDYLEATPFKTGPKILIGPISTGPELYSFVMRAKIRGLYEKHSDMQVYGVEINPQLTEMAKEAVYPVFMRAQMQRQLLAYPNYDTAAFDQFFEFTPDGKSFRIADEIRSRVTILPAQDLARHEGRYDMAICLHLLQLVSSEKQKEILTRLLNVAPMVCVNPEPFVSSRALFNVFGNLGRGAAVSPLDQNLRPTRPIRMGMLNEIEHFRKPRTQAKEMLIYRHS